jgi:tRNA A-37 threonylcarbamoyl transferase component Bud32
LFIYSNDERRFSSNETGNLPGGTMNTPPMPICPKCGVALPVDAPQGLCPRCIGAMNLATETAFTDEDAAATEAPLSPDELAPHFPQLEIIEFLGRGGMGVVYKARQKSLNRVVALKLLAPERVTDAKFAERFTREAQALAQLNHQHIVTIYDFGQAGGFYFLMMEFVDGVNLRQALRGGRFTPEQALAIVPPICDALQYAHERGIVHRDIKPENLLLDKSGQVKIADFGIAKMVGGEVTPVGPADSATLQQTAAGTPQYMAPEQKEQPRKADHRADIYSLGVVLYEMLTGELPDGKLQPPSRRVRIDVRLDEIVLRALEKEPERRYATADEFKTSIQTVAPGTATELPRRLPTELPSEVSAKRISQLALALFLAGTLGVLLLMTISPQHKLALLFGAVALLVALVCGVLSWRERLGKIVTVAALAILLGTGMTVATFAVAVPWLSEARHRAAVAKQREKQAALAQAIAEREALRRNDAAATDSKAGSKRERFEPREGMASQTSWSVHNKPSAINPNGWAVMARMTLGGEAPVRLRGHDAELFRITLIEGNDNQITVGLREPARPATVTLKVRRDQPEEFTIDGRKYRILYPSNTVMPDQPDTSPFAHIIVTPVGQELPTGSGELPGGNKRGFHRLEDAGTPTETTKNQAKAEFLPIIELTLPIEPKQFLNLADGRIHTSPPINQPTVSVAREPTGRLLIEISETHSYLLKREDGMKQWKDKSAAELMDDYRRFGFALLPFERFFAPPIPEDKLPMTILFPGWGFMQVTGIVTGATPGVKLRYKLIRSVAPEEETRGSSRR